MRVKLAGALVAVATLGFAGFATAQQVQDNLYEVYGDVHPNKVGTKKKPLPVGLEIGYRATESDGLRPNPVKQYTISIYGGRENTNLFPGCTSAEINAAMSDEDCPKGSLVGSGNLDVVAGATSDPTDTSIKCQVPVKVYNSGKGKAAIYLVTQQPACAVTINQAIDARYVDAFGKKGRGMQFEVPDNLLHPIPGLSIAVMQLDVELPRKTTRVKGKRRGYFESTVPCFKGDRWGQLDFVTEDGTKGSERYVKPC